MELTLKGQVALVTGGSRGIGRDIVLALGQRGAQVMVNYRENKEAAEEALHSLMSAGGSGELCAFDVAQEDQVEGAVKKIVDHHKKIDILVNNAGLTSNNLLVRVSGEEWDRVIGVNLKGTFHCTKSVCR